MRVKVAYITKSFAVSGQVRISLDQVCMYNCELNLDDGSGGGTTEMYCMNQFILLIQTKST